MPEEHPQGIKVPINLFQLTEPFKGNDLLPALREFPDIGPAGGLMAHVDAGMPDEVLRVFRRAVGGEIGRRDDRHQPPVQSDADCDHVLLDALAELRAGIEIADDVQSRHDAEFIGLDD